MLFSSKPFLLLIIYLIIQTVALTYHKHYRLITLMIVKMINLTYDNYVEKI